MKNHFFHDTAEKTLAKARVIGSAYAAALERRKNKSDVTGNFYLDAVVAKFKGSRLHDILADVKAEEFSADALHGIVDAHRYSTRLLFEIAGLDKRSSGSKYQQ